LRDDRQAFDQALDECFSSLNELSDRPGSYLARGSLLEDLGREDQAEAAYRLAMRLDPNTVGPRSNLATLLARRAWQIREQAELSARRGDRKHASALLEQLVSDDVFVGHLLSEETDLLQRDAALAPEIGGLQYQLAVALYLQDRPDEAEAALRKAIDLEPNEATYRFKLATELEGQQRPDEALVQARAALELWPKDKSYQELVARLEKAVPK
jgi:tetratricopeptide (TPR) repeat protein